MQSTQLLIYTDLRDVPVLTNPKSPVHTVKRKRFWPSFLKEIQPSPLSTSAQEQGELAERSTLTTIVFQ
jgi:hypothetical protein